MAPFPSAASTCPHCGQAAVRVLPELSKVARVDYVSCDACARAWTADKCTRSESPTPARMRLTGS